MKIGTKSVLVGAHQFAIHPVLIAFGWWKAFGFRRVRIGERLVWESTRLNDGAELRRHIARPVFTRLLDPRLWVAFVVHDVGYLGKPNMDGPEGETHPEVGAAIMRRLFGEPWGEFVLTHSRYYAKRLGRPLSPLCYADKWTIVLEPWWLYGPRVRLSGELAEYTANARRRAETVTGPDDPLTAEERTAFLVAETNPRGWNRALRSYMRRWIQEHQDGKADTWTRVRHREAV